ncbi:MAG: IS110 family transposase, partial [Nitrospirae bacterium]|nr:IS110 family transposase [Nitrospirota bacterium]
MKISKTQRGRAVNKEELIVGIDVAKTKHFVRILFSDGSESAPFGFLNIREGFEALLSWVSSFRRRFNNPHVIVGLESTGHYWESLAFFLDGITGITLVQVNPSHVRRTKDLYDNSPGKTDSKDAGVIAMLIRMGKYHPMVLPRGPFADLRGFAKLREQKVVEFGVQRNILHSIVDVIFPEYGSVFKKLEEKTSLHILKTFTTPARIVEAGIQRITAELRKASHGQLSEAVARALVEAATHTVGLTEGIEANVFAITRSVESIERIQGDIEAIEGKLIEVLQRVSYATRLSSIPGMGPVSLAVILGETGDMLRYRRAEEVIKLAGLNLFEISSGKHKGQKHITKRGRALLRKCLFFAALRMVKKRGAFREDYCRLTQENQMHKTKALVALSRKLLRVLFAMVRDGSVYQQRGIELA